VVVVRDPDGEKSRAPSREYCRRDEVIGLEDVNDGRGESFLRLRSE